MTWLQTVNAVLGAARGAGYSYLPSQNGILPFLVVLTVYPSFGFIAASFNVHSPIRAARNYSAGYLVPFPLYPGS